VTYGRRGERPAAFHAPGIWVTVVPPRDRSIAAIAAQAIWTRTLICWGSNRTLQPFS
jgi:hypothetical protein